MHANSGVEKGMAQGGKPVEIMGMMLGRPDTETPNALIVTDVSFFLLFCLHTVNSSPFRRQVFSSRVGVFFRKLTWYYF